MLYVLDEPSIGLHQRDNERLLGTLRRLRDLGNTVLVVEHDEDAIRSADHLIDMGPAAGVHGGHVIAEGTPAEVAANTKSLTGDYLSGRTEASRCRQSAARCRRTAAASRRRARQQSEELCGQFPLGTFTCVTGVSGGGKSTLVIDTLYKARGAPADGRRRCRRAHDRIEGLDQLDKIIDIDQSPIGRTPRCNPATYTDLFARSATGSPNCRKRAPAATSRAVSVSTSRAGAAKPARATALLKIEMHFLPDVYVTCDTCKGKRYNRETLEIKFRGKSIADVLAMTVDEAVPFFSAQPRIHDRLTILQQVGLGYIALGQQATTLSGGEAQRIKLAKELARRATGRTLYILDEPTTGLHFEDVRKLLEVLHALVDQGNTVVVIEHNLEVIKTADWILDLGPEGGDGGGRIVAEGTPEDIVANPESYTGRFLAPLLPPWRRRRRRGGEPDERWRRGSVRGSHLGFNARTRPAAHTPASRAPRGLEKMRNRPRHNQTGSRGSGSFPVWRIAHGDAAHPTPHMRVARRFMRAPIGGLLLFR